MTTKTVLRVVDTTAIAVMKNTARTRSFISELRQATRGKFIIRTRGRDKNRKAKAKKYNITTNYCRDMPVKYAERIAIYMDKVETKQVEVY